MGSDELLKFFEDINKLKSTARAGWVRCGIKNPESVADHTFRTAMMAMVLGDSLQLDVEKVLRMALLHDLAEVVTGDITPYDDESPEEKRRKEGIALYGLLQQIPNRDKYMELWQEYDQQLSVEAKLVRNVDKLEMALQADEYKQKFPECDLSEFFSDAEKYFDVVEVKEIFGKLKI